MKSAGAPEAAFSAAVDGTLSALFSVSLNVCLPLLLAEPVTASPRQAATGKAERNRNGSLIQGWYYNGKRPQPQRRAAGIVTPSIRAGHMPGGPAGQDFTANLGVMADIDGKGPVHEYVPDVARDFGAVPERQQGPGQSVSLPS